MAADGSNAFPTTVDPDAWCGWEPVDHATLVFVVRDGKILLIRKKRGLGAGKVNGPGGKIESDESARECAVREVEEELCVTPTAIVLSGELRFQFVDGYAIHVTVYRADDCIGEPSETDEAVPMWTSIDRIPYHEMWADDRIWLPLLLAGERFSGRFVFDDDVMLAAALEEVAAA